MIAAAGSPSTPALSLAEGEGVAHPSPPKGEKVPFEPETLVSSEEARAEMVSGRQ